MDVESTLARASAELAAIERSLAPSSGVGGGAGGMRVYATPDSTVGITTSADGNTVNVSVSRAGAGAVGDDAWAGGGAGAANGAPTASFASTRRPFASSAAAGAVPHGLSSPPPSTYALDAGALADLGVSLSGRGASSRAVLKALGALQAKIRSLEAEKAVASAELDRTLVAHAEERERWERERREAAAQAALEEARARTAVASLKAQRAELQAAVSARDDELRALHASVDALQRDLAALQAALHAARGDAAERAAAVDDMREHATRLEVSVAELSSALRATQATSRVLLTESRVARSRAQAMADLNRTMAHTLPSPGAPAAAPAAAPKPKRKAGAPKTRTAPRGRSASGRSTLPGAVSSAGGGAPPFLTGAHAGPSHSLIANVQLALSQPEAHGVAPRRDARPAASAASRSRSRSASARGAAEAEAVRRPRAASTESGAYDAASTGALSAAEHTQSLAAATLGRVEALLGSASRAPVARGPPQAARPPLPPTTGAATHGRAAPAVPPYVPGSAASSGGDADDLWADIDPPASAAASAAAAESAHPALAATFSAASSMRLDALGGGGGAGDDAAEAQHGGGGGDADPRFTASGRMIPHRSRHPEAEMEGVVAALEAEFAALQERYDRLVLASASLAAGSDGQAGDPALLAQLNTALRELQDMMRRKAQQLDALRTAQAEVTDARERSPVRSPEAAARKARALRTMRAMRDLAAAANPRIGGGTAESGRDPRLVAPSDQAVPEWR
jgi:hypothetical protein